MDDVIEQPEEQMQEEALVLKVSINEINVVLAALAELPHRVSDPLIRKLMQQAQEQLPKPN